MRINLTKKEGYHPLVRYEIIVHNPPKITGVRTHLNATKLELIVRSRVNPQEH